MDNKKKKIQISDFSTKELISELGTRDFDVSVGFIEKYKIIYLENRVKELAVRLTVTKIYNAILHMMILIYILYWSFHAKHPLFPSDITFNFLK